MKTLATLLFLILAFLTNSIFATTWDEPWQDKIMKEADCFVLANVKSNDEKNGAVIEIIKTLGGEELQGDVTINNFYLLDLCSTSGGHGPEFNFIDSTHYYFFIKKNENGNYNVSTPTSGFAGAKDGFVYGTYRHSYHQAKIPVDVYEKTMTAIFNNYHNKPYDKAYINEFIQKYLSQKPAGYTKEEINTFFLQHVALESIYHLKLTNHYYLVLPFLLDYNNFHSQISAARALIAYNTSECKEELLKIISNKEADRFVQVICIWTLTDFKPKELKKQLIEIAKNASEEETGFGGNIMDPRICTYFPTVKAALDKLIEQL